MEIRDLGVIDAQLAVFGGVYSNLQAFDAFQTAMNDTGLPPAQWINTGDLVAYCADPKAVVERAQALPMQSISGNCEVQLAEDAEDCGCGFDAGSTCSVLSASWYGFARAAMDAQQKQWMGSLPDILVFTQYGRRVAVVHGGLSDISAFLWSVSQDDAFQREIDLIEAALGKVDVVLAGHSGIAFERQIAGVQWINAGAIGMVANDGQQGGAYAVLSAEGVAFHKLTYDADLARDTMVTAGLTQGYHDALVTGYWPSEDVLPDVLKRAGGDQKPALSALHP